RRGRGAGCLFWWFWLFCALRKTSGAKRAVVTRGEASRKYSEHAVTAAGITGQVAMKAHVRRLLRQRLSTQVVIATVAILVVTMAAGFAVVQWNLNRQLNEQYEQRDLAVAQSLACQPGLA